MHAEDNGDHRAGTGRTETPREAPRGALNAFARFVVCGGGVSLASSAVLPAVGHRLPFALANAVITAAGTLLATELHHRFTFGAARAGRAGWRIHAKSALTLAAAYLVTTAAVLVLGAVHPHSGALLAQAVYLAASGLAGIGRFLVLRLVVFTRRTAERPAAGPALYRGEVAVAA
ncbi:GtrA family protein [Actinacidiphila acidipaludis]|uniref:GtrA family protein n=1 Tax=Actinacidiphila acidipaludis TaxID=2873382 RepID=A0ABS7Q7W8_9ACTN|nr:GtrA family protein [Streptomyces acidipaludis]MBY8878926.1 GtrA family protein [Streptomyces acidipaludis]